MPVRFFCAGIAQLVERNLAKVEVGSSSLLSRSRLPRGKRAAAVFPFDFSANQDHAPVRKARLEQPARTLAGWQSGHAAACKAVYAGSIPTPASITHYENGTPTHLSSLGSVYTAVLRCICASA